MQTIINHVDWYNFGLYNPLALNRIKNLFGSLHDQEQSKVKYYVIFSNNKLDSIAVQSSRNLNIPRKATTEMLWKILSLMIFQIFGKLRQKWSHGGVFISDRQVVFA